MYMGKENAVSVTSIEGSLFGV